MIDVDAMHGLIRQHYISIGRKPTHLIVSYEIYQDLRVLADRFMSKYSSIKPDEEPDRFMGLEVCISTKNSKIVMEVV